ncbi:MAG TPA: hypothetical protein VL381_08945 [Rhodocyclaceae bacterium]|jgi:hypothetical protein|nr:hypothetical protein [Rhodocyclaceae bacterium]
MKPSQLVESYKFWDIVTLWARERLEHEIIVARSLARGVIMDGLRLQSADPRWLNQNLALTGYPYVGYVAAEGRPPVILRAEVLEHLLAIVRSAEEPSPVHLAETFVSRTDFLHWLMATGQALPSFWFSKEMSNT